MWDLPDCSSQAHRQCEKRHIRFMKGPVPCGERGSQDHFAQSRDEEYRPEETDHIQKLRITFTSFY